MLNWLFRCTT